jgi:hypothetical protein
MVDEGNLEALKIIGDGNKRKNLTLYNIYINKIKPD